MIERIKLKDLINEYQPKTQVMTWTVEKIDVVDYEDAPWGHLLYWRVMEEQNGFEVYFVNTVSRELDADFEDTEVEVVFHCVAFFDGVRHIWFNSHDKEGGMQGYVNYPNIPAMIKALCCVGALQKTFCYDYEGEDLK